MRSLFNPLLLLAAAALLAGCAGVGGTSEYGCKAPPGVSCQSVSGVHANAMQRNLPSQRAEDAVAATTNQQDYKATVAGAPLSSGMPLRSQTRVLRVWIAPWEDSEGDLNDQSFSYVVVDSGRWMIDHNRRNIAKEYEPLRPPSGINATNAKPEAEAKAFPQNGG